MAFPGAEYEPKGLDWRDGVVSRADPDTVATIYCSSEKLVKPPYAEMHYVALATFDDL
ncbi:MAG: hypothetical protein ACJ71B_10490 [Nitrososphaera sp.]